MSPTMIAPCGLDCGKCDAYLLTQADDLAGKEALAAKWRADYQSPEITVKDVTCDGCLAATGRHGGHCAKCEIRACAVGKKLTTCAECDQFACERLQGFFLFVPPAKENLQALRK